MRANDRPDEQPNELFERLWLLRHCYPLRSAYDADGTLTIAQVIEHGERLIRQARWQERRTWRGPSRTAA